MNPNFSTPQTGETRSELNRFPAIEDWRAVQGGKPTLWLNEKGNNIVVVHIYESSTGDLIGNGKRVATPLRETGDGHVLPTQMKHLIMLPSANEDRTVAFPVFPSLLALFSLFPPAPAFLVPDRPLLKK